MAKHLKPGGNKKLAPWLTTVIIAGVVIIGGGLTATHWPHHGDSTPPSTTEARISTPPPLSSVALAPVAVPQPTLVLLDASLNMEDHTDGQSIFALSRRAIIDAANESGQPLALWNYSSALTNSGAKGWRTNTGFESIDQVTPVLMGLGTGGVPQTREALLAALPVAAAEPNPVTIVLITSATADGAADAAGDQAFADQVRAALNPKDTLNVVHVGGRETDMTLSSVATNTSSARTAAEIHSAIARAWGLKI
ncbi:MAG: hypothetical protein Q3962_01845 [Corynebacterium sp.]|nr:hypothetical protein [Corynebacterium sp.]